MHRPLVSFVTAFVALLMLSVIAGLVLQVAADANGWNSFSLGTGPLMVLQLSRTTSATSTSWGPGLLLACAAFAALNVAAARALRNRSDGGT